MRFKLWLLAMIVGASFSAFAGKQERDKMTKKVMPELEAAQKAYKGACGCALAITVDEATIKTTDDMQEAIYMARSITEGAPKYCTDDASKKAICQMKSVTLAKSKPAAFTFKDGKGTMTTDGQSHCSWDMITRQLDK